ncbi:bile acid:sodium symporter family protein [Alkalimarinus sediminis]|uniref:Bile acid:sodium symporter family protein n=1 Tax=Alkalimarinus sediminis TaxID=1632866 RepID=A0A9E8HM02_9ALTE|nr:bile acid:sodium symporter family protein [Alkalimarinus sediminis]UZW76577.1 bile acid:sodium symporter family protein [Alkalimarinus sediminis]
MSGVLTTVVLPLSLAVIMLGMGMSLTVADFKRVIIYPKAVAIGIIGQILLLPLVGYFFASQFNLSPENAVGLMVLVACAGGATSNLIVYLARGDVALSVTLTAISSCITVITIPFIVNFALYRFMGATEETALPIGSTNMKLFAITLVPVIFGMTIRYYFTGFAKRMENPMNKIATVFFVLIVVGILLKEHKELFASLLTVGPATFLLNLTSMSLGFIAARIFELNSQQSTTVSIEIGVQNSATGIFIATTLLHNSEVAIVPAVYSLMMYLNAGLFLFIMSKCFNRTAVVERAPS